MILGRYEVSQKGFYLPLLRVFILLGSLLLRDPTVLPEIGYRQSLNNQLHKPFFRISIKVALQVPAAQLHFETIGFAVFKSCNGQQLGQATAFVFLWNNRGEEVKGARRRQRTVTQYCATVVIQVYKELMSFLGVLHEPWCRRRLGSCGGRIGHWYVVQESSQRSSKHLKQFYFLTCVTTKYIFRNLLAMTPSRKKTLADNKLAVLPEIITGKFTRSTLSLPIQIPKLVPSQIRHFN